MPTISQIIRTGEAWERTTDGIIKNLPVDAAGKMEMLVKLNDISNQVFSLNKIVWEIMKQAEKTGNISYIA